MFDQILSVKPTAGQEQDFRLQILDALLKTPHREVEPYFPLFKHIAESDPRFFGQLAVWYRKHGQVRDLNNLFISFMCSSDFDSTHREAGLTMAQSLPPFQLERVLKVIKGGKIRGKFSKGIAGSVPRSFRTAIKQYLSTREGNREHFDSAAMNARSSLKTLYASLRIKPGPYAQAVLFDDLPPEGSVFYVLKQISKLTDPAEQARLLVENQIPYRIAVSLVKAMSPPVLVALINAMTPQEVMNNLHSLKERGVMENPDLRKMVESKLEAGKTDKRVSALKTRVAAQAADLDEELSDLLQSVGDQQIKSKGRITKSTALLVDKSGSLAVALEVGKQLAAVIAPVCENGLHVFCFDTITYPIKAQGVEMSDWEKAFKGIQASGGTSCGAPIELMRKQGIKVEQIIMVTDQGENTSPTMLPSLQTYSKEFGMPSVIFINVGQFSKELAAKLKKAEVEVDEYTFTGDYYSLPGIIPLLAGGSRLDLLNEIMSLELPKRKVSRETVAVSH